MPGSSCRRSTTRSTRTSTRGSTSRSSLIGAHMAADLAAAGKRGVLTQAMYDNWWNGGNRTTPQRHNIVAVLTEAASVRLATPIFLDTEDLRADARGFTEPPPGGQLRRPLAGRLVAAPRHRRLRADLRPVDPDPRRAVQRPVPGEPAGDGAATRSPQGKRRAPLRLGRPARPARPRHGRPRWSASSTTRASRSSAPRLRSRPRASRYPAGTWILPAAQPYRAHLKDMMERQVYPDAVHRRRRGRDPVRRRRLDPARSRWASGPSRSPSRSRSKTERARRASSRSGAGSRAPIGRPTFSRSATRRTTTSSSSTPAARGGRRRSERASTGDRRRGESPGAGSLRFPADEKARRVLDQVLPDGLDPGHVP